MIRITQPVMAAATFLLLAGAGVAQEKRYVVIDQDAAGPGGTRGHGEVRQNVRGADDAGGAGTETVNAHRQACGSTSGLGG